MADQDGTIAAETTKHFDAETIWARQQTNEVSTGFGEFDDYEIAFIWRTDGREDAVLTRYWPPVVRLEDRT